MDINEIVSGIRRGDVRAIARSMSIVENDSPKSEVLLESIFTYTGKAYRIGVTGPPGAGKSTLTAGLTARLREQGKTVGIVAVDPTSPFSGGALLGDRIRMVQFSSDPGVFVRSMASRGGAGGLAAKAQEVADILDAAGKEFIFLETVGVGQTELDVARAADTTVVVLVPESGDAIQTMKAGLMEIADLFVVNKADREGAERLVKELRQMTGLRSRIASPWEMPVLTTVATTGEGISELLKAILSHKEMMEEKGMLRKRRENRLRFRVKEIVNRYLYQSFWTGERNQLLEERLSKVAANHTSPYALARKLIKDFQDDLANS